MQLTETQQHLHNPSTSGPPSPRLHRHEPTLAEPSSEIASAGTGHDLGLAHGSSAFVLSTCKDSASVKCVGRHPSATQSANQHLTTKPTDGTTHRQEPTLPKQHGLASLLAATSRNKQTRRSRVDLSFHLSEVATTIDKSRVRIRQSQASKKETSEHQPTRSGHQAGSEPTSFGSGAAFVTRGALGSDTHCSTLCTSPDDIFPFFPLLPSRSMHSLAMLIQDDSRTCVTFVSSIKARMMK